jgi:hypothetical protein
MITDIKLASTLEEVQEIRKQQVAIERVGGDHDRIQRILTEDMYSNPLRFIYVFHIVSLMLQLLFTFLRNSSARPRSRATQTSGAGS